MHVSVVLFCFVVMYNINHTVDLERGEGSIFTGSVDSYFRSQFRPPTNRNYRWQDRTIDQVKAARGI
jgi:hypothetical protein